MSIVGTCAHTLLGIGYLSLSCCRLKIIAKNIVLFTGSRKSSQDRSKRYSWTEKALRTAIAAIKNGEITQTAAAVLYGIPRRTIVSHLKTGSLVKRTGRVATFDEVQEKKLVERILKLSKRGMPLTSKNIRKQAFDFCLEHKIKNTFNITTGLAGSDWFRSFRKRHPHLCNNAGDETL